MHRSARRRGPALMAAAVLLGTIGGTSLGLLEGGGRGPTAAAPAQAATAAPNSSRASTAPHRVASTSTSSGDTPTEQRLSAPRRQLDRGAKAGKSKPKQKEPGDSGKRSHGKGKDKDKQAHDH
jgi:hypothetical protein